MVRVFPTSSHANEHVLLALGSNRTGRDDVEICLGRGQFVRSRRFIRVKPHKTNVQQML